MSQKVTTGVRPTLRIADKNQIPATEPERQYYFMDIAKEYLRQLSEEKGSPLTFHVSTFGCQMNARDSEKLVGILEKIGYVEEDSEKADFVIYNTCTVRENANNKVYGRLGYLNGFQKKNPFMMIGLCGCMMQEPTVVEKIKQSYRFVNLIFGTHNIYKFAELLCRSMESNSMIVDIWKDTDKIVEDLPIKRKFSFKSGVNIMFGCNNFCSYCIVPYVRGRERSRDAESILREVRDLQQRGFKEVTLLGQNVNSYGLSPSGKREEGSLSFAELLHMVAQAVPDMRVRFTTSNPEDMTEDILHAIAEEPNLCKHIHFPAQSGSNKILKLMNRKYTREEYLQRIADIKRIIPGCGITTDIFVGYHDETEEDHQETLSLVKEVGFDSAFMFKYSERPGTYAAKHLPDNVSEETKIARLNELIKLQTEVSAEQNKKDEGKEFTILIENFSKRSREQMMGRTEQNKAVVIDKGNHHIGEFVKVRITGSTSATLFGEEVKE